MSVTTGTREMRFQHDGRDRPYLLHVPAGAPAPAPLLVELHGRGIDALRFDGWTGFRALGDDRGFAVALPQAIGETWNDGRFPELERSGPDDVGYLGAIAEDACARFALDPARVYVAGMSNGATMAGRLACERPDVFAAIAQVAGTASVDVAARSRPRGPLPILEIHGTADPHAPYEGGRRRRLLARLLVRRGARPSLGVEEWAALWREANETAAVPRIDARGPDTTVRSWHGRVPVSEVVVYRVEGMGHTWPGNTRPVPALLFGRTTHTFDATAVIWEFVSRHRREE